MIRPWSHVSTSSPMAAIQHENFAKRSQFNAIHPPGRIGQAGLDSSGTSGTCNFHPRQAPAPDSIPDDPIESIESIALYHPVRHGQQRGSQVSGPLRIARQNVPIE